jgi:hypothetical protein
MDDDDIDRFFDQLDQLGPEYDDLKALREAAKRVPSPTPEEAERMERRFFAAIDAKVRAEEQARAEQARAEDLRHEPPRARRPEARARTWAVATAAAAAVLLALVAAGAGSAVMVAQRRRSTERQAARAPSTMGPQTPPAPPPNPRPVPSDRVMLAAPDAGAPRR